MKGISKVVFLLVVVLSVGAQNNADVRIIGGSYARQGQFPFVVSIDKNDNFQCGGSIISRDWIVTAAHCFDKSTAQDRFVVFAGLLNQNERHQASYVQSAQIVRYYTHPYYQHGGSFKNDIAMAKLNSSLMYNPLVQHINLPTINWEKSEGQGVVMGWGRTDIGLDSNTLKYFTAPILPIDECETLTTTPQPTTQPTTLQLKNVYESTTESQICTKFEKPQKAACFGDSGGPLIQDDVIIGVVSWVSNECKTGPTFYTKVSSFLDFINYYVYQ